MKKKLEFSEPVLLVDERRCRRNIAAMVDKARALNLALRPHFKTHQSRAIGRWFRDYGVDRIAVSSVGMAEYFADDGWEDITIAFPAHPQLWDRIDRLARRVKLNLIFDAPEVLRYYGARLRAGAGFFIEVDTGQGRSGVHHRDLGTMARMLDSGRRSHLRFQGFLTHAGQAYRARSALEVKAIGQAAISAIAAVKKHFSLQYPRAIVSYGDTPTATLLEDFPGIDELRPGNFVFHDLMQVGWGVCSRDGIAIALACPVVSAKHSQNRVVVHGGAVHLSKERLSHPIYGEIYGQAVCLDENGLGRARDCYVVDLTQEHGVIAGPKDQISRLKPGTTLAIYPVHSCLAAESMAGYRTFGGRYLDHARAEALAKFMKEIQDGKKIVNHRSRDASVGGRALGG